MKIVTAQLAFVLIACLSMTAAAQDLAGSWQAETVSGVEPPEGAALKLAFGDEDIATITYTLAGESQSWQYRYSVVDGQLNLEPAKPFGEPQTITYDIKFDEDKLLLLSPKPAEEDTEAQGEGESDKPAGDEATDAEEEAEEVEEEDNRVPVWVLTKA